MDTVSFEQHDSPVVAASTSKTYFSCEGTFLGGSKTGENQAAAGSSSRKEVNGGVDLGSFDAFPSLGTGKAPMNDGSNWSNRTSSEYSGKGKAPLTASLAEMVRPQVTGSSEVVVERFSIPASQQLNLGEQSNKAALSDVVKNVMQKTGTQIDISTTKNTGAKAFLVRGKADAALRAKRMILASLAVKVTSKMAIPAAMRKFVVGTRGKTLNAITDMSSTKIHLPSRQELASGGDTATESEKQEKIEITISGDQEGVLLARTEIQKILMQHTPKFVMKLDHLPAFHNHFVNVAHRDDLQQLMEKTEVRIRIPPYVAGDDESKNAERHITLVGDEENVKAAAAQINGWCDKLKDEIRTLTIDIPKTKHRFIIGPKGANLAEIQDATGCLIELPSASAPSEVILVRGVRKGLVRALDLLFEKADSVHLETLNLVTAYGDIEYGRNILRYFIKSGKLRRIEQHFDVQVSHPALAKLLDAAEVLLEISGKSKEAVAAAKNHVAELARAMPPGYFFATEIDARLRPFIIGKKGQHRLRLQEKHGIEIIFPDERDDDDEVLFVLEKCERVKRIPEKKERTQAAKEHLQKIYADIEAEAKKAANVVTQVADIPAKYHKTIIGPKGATLNGIINNPESTIVRFGSSISDASRKKDPLVANLTPDQVFLRGPREEVERIVGEMKKIVEEAKHTAIMHSFTAEVAVSEPYLPHLIGRSGSNLNRLKEKYDVQIDIPERKESRDAGSDAATVVKLQGTKKGVEEARKELQLFADKLADTAANTLSIPLQYHSLLIGKQGRSVKQIEDKHGVRIHFSAGAKGSASGDAGAAPSEVIVRGSKKGVAEASKELMVLYEQEKGQNEKDVIQVPAQCLPHVVGKSGSKITKIMSETGARIDILRPGNDEKWGGSDMVTVTLRGSLENIEKAKQIILRIAHEIQDQLTVRMSINPLHHKFLIGPSGSQIRSIVFGCGGKKDDVNKVVKFPRADASDPSEVVLKGPSALVLKVQREIERIVQERESIAEITFTIPKRDRVAVSGDNNSNLREIEDEFGVKINLEGPPPPNQPGDEPENLVVVHICGDKDKCKEAKERVLSFAQAEDRLPVPVSRHQFLLGHNNANIRRLREEFGVTVEHPEEENFLLLSVAKKGKGAPPSSALGSLTITWILRGHEDQLPKAKHLLQTWLRAAEAECCVEKIGVPANFHRLVIGRGGETVSRIKAETGCQIDVPRSTTGGSFVTISGPEKGIKRAKQLIEEVIAGAA